MIKITHGVNQQNNGKGGYAWGPKMYYYAGSQLTIEWTAQHGCGPDDKQKNLHCEIIIQYTCGNEVRDGTTTTTIPGTVPILPLLSAVFLLPPSQSTNMLYCVLFLCR